MSLRHLFFTITMGNRNSTLLIAVALAMVLSLAPLKESSVSASGGGAPKKSAKGAVTTAEKKSAGHGREKIRRHGEEKSFLSRRKKPAVGHDTEGEKKEYKPDPLTLRNSRNC